MKQNSGGGSTGGRLQPDLMQLTHPTAICQNLVGEGVWGGGGGRIQGPGPAAPPPIGGRQKYVGSSNVLDHGASLAPMQPPVPIAHAADVTVVKAA